MTNFSWHTCECVFVACQRASASANIAIEWAWLRSVCACVWATFSFVSNFHLAKWHTHFLFSSMSVEHYIDVCGVYYECDEHVISNSWCGSTVLWTPGLAIWKLHVALSHCARFEFCGCIRRRTIEHQHRAHAKMILNDKPNVSNKDRALPVAVFGMKHSFGGCTHLIHPSS